MSNVVSYIFEIQDKMSRTMQKIGRSMTALSRETERSQRHIRQQLQKTQTQTQAMTSSIRNMVGAYLGISATRGVVGNLEEYERALNKANALTMASTEEQAILREMSGRLGAITEKTASQVASAAGQMGLWGIAVKDINTMMPSIINLSTALGQDLAYTGQEVASIMKKLNVPLSKTPEILNKIAVATTNTGATLGGLGHAFAGASGTITSLGIDVNEAFAIMSVASETLGERTGFAFKAMLRQISLSEDATSPAGKILKQYGIAFDEVNPKIHSVAEIVNTLTPIISNGADIFGFFGSEGKEMAQLMEREFQRIKKVEEIVTNNTTALQKAGQIMRKGLPGAMDKMRSLLDGLIKSFGEEGLTGAITRTANGIAKVATFINNNKFIVKMTLWVVGLTAKIWLLQKGLLAIHGALLLVRGLMVAMAAVNPFTAIVTTILLAIELGNKLASKMQGWYDKFAWVRNLGSTLANTFSMNATPNQGIQLPQSKIEQPKQANLMSQIFQGNMKQSASVDINVNHSNAPQGTTMSVAKESKGANFLSLGVNSMV